MTLMVFVLFSLSIFSPVSADVPLYDPTKEQVRTELLSQINGTQMSTGQYVQIVWPELYSSMSQDTQIMLAGTQNIRKKSLVKEFVPFALSDDIEVSSSTVFGVCSYVNLV